MRVGIDLLEIARITRIAAHSGGRRIVFSTAELAYADTLGAVRCTEYLAGRFCAKEATAKALGRGLGQGLTWREIEVLADAHGAPQVLLSGGARTVAEQAGIGRIDLSLSHQGGLVVCVAVALPREAPAPASPCEAPAPASPCTDPHGTSPGRTAGAPS
ncbi:holo-ACP synthase [Kitasatospora paranensis]|uniref:Holo-[acyl-carrier-protein] synthase n=1 Tax=Kitasatospora paranensis TaxID=258053 RepID=A0ABW2G0S1_9ACTN